MFQLSCTEVIRTHFLLLVRCNLQLYDVVPFFVVAFVTLKLPHFLKIPFFFARFFLSHWCRIISAFFSCFGKTVLQCSGFVLLLFAHLFFCVLLMYEFVHQLTRFSDLSLFITSFSIHGAKIDPQLLYRQRQVHFPNVWVYFLDKGIARIYEELVMFAVFQVMWITFLNALEKRKFLLRHESEL